MTVLGVWIRKLTGWSQMLVYIFPAIHPLLQRIFENSALYSTLG